VMRPHMRFVPIKTEEQQAALMLHKARDLLVRQQTMLINAIRGHMAELGMIAPQGCTKIKELIAVIQESDDESIPALARGAVVTCVGKAFGDLRLGEVSASCGEVNDLIGRLFAEAFPAVNFPHRNLTRSQQGPK